MAFTQNFYGSIGTVVNVETLNGGVAINGQQILTASSTQSDLVAQLEQIRRAIGDTSDLNKASKSTAVARIDAAMREAKAERPKGHQIKAELDGATEALQSATNAASKALSLGKVLVGIGKWAMALFA